MAGDDRQMLLDEARTGNQEALGKLLDGFRPYVRVLVHAVRGRRLGGQLDDSDLIQDALLQAARSFAEFRGTTAAEFIGWLRQITLRAAARAFRSLDKAPRRDPVREQFLESLETVADVGSSPSAQLIRREQAARVAEALGHLPEDMRQVVLLRLVDELPHADIAERLGRTSTAVRMLYLRALRRLRGLCPE
jgi:RNA polymerase sigma-70 factor (ECF subfamily)